MGRSPTSVPGFTCTAEITTATRDNVLSVPIQAMTIREMVVDASGNIVREPVKADAPRPRRRHYAQHRPQARSSPARSSRACSSFATTTPSSSRSTTGIAGEKYFEVLSGLKEKDQVIIGPFSLCARDLATVRR